MAPYTRRHRAYDTKMLKLLTDIKAHYTLNRKQPKSKSKSRSKSKSPSPRAVKYGKLEKS